MTISASLLARARASVAETPCIVVTEDNLEFWWGSREYCERWITWQLEDEEHISEWTRIDVDPMDFRVIDNTIERVLSGWGYAL